MPTLTPPCVIRYDQLCEGMLVELTRPDNPDWLTQARVDRIDTDGAAYLRGHGYLLAPDRYTIRALEVPEPPKPALPTAWGTVIRIKGGNWDGQVAVLAGMASLRWITPDRDTGYWWISEVGITDWTILYDPSAPKAEPEADDGLRERVEQLAEYYSGPGWTPSPAVAARLRDVLDGSADA